jgi:L-asparaginase II
VIERFGLDERHLAVGCASHGGGPEHVARVREMLVAAGLDERALACGVDRPRDPRLIATDPSPLVHNCSGKHALALALCVARGWPTLGYLSPGHPLQVELHETVAGAMGVPTEAVPLAGDGCGMRTFQVALQDLAGAFGRLASGGFGEAGEQIARAMWSHPRLIAYEGAIDTELMAAHPGLLAKIGAEGVIGIGLPDGRGAAVKVLDGAMRALDPIAVSVARGVLGLELEGGPLTRLAAPLTFNSRGERAAVLSSEAGDSPPAGEPARR